MDHGQDMDGHPRPAGAIGPNPNPNPRTAGAIGPITLTLAPQAASMRLPACVFVTRAEVLRGAEAAARTALRGLEVSKLVSSARAGGATPRTEP